MAWTGQSAGVRPPGKGTDMSDNQILLDAEDMPWSCAPTRGVSFKTLRFDHDTRAGAVMIHMCPGTTYPRFSTEKGQDVYVVDGELIIEESRVGRGSYAWMPAGREHAPTSDKGCVLFVTFPGAVHHRHENLS